MSVVDWLVVWCVLAVMVAVAVCAVIGGADLDEDA